MNEHNKNNIIKDINLYRYGRYGCDVMETWKKYKNQIIESIIFKYGHDELCNKELLKIVRENPECVEIVADTIIGWLNTHVGRGFLRQAFNTEDIPLIDPKGTE